MNALRPHHGWLLALGAALLLAAASDPLLRYARNGMAEESRALDAEHARISQSLMQLRDDAATAQRLSRTITSKDMEKYLAPTDRAKIAARLEPIATASRLSRFTYTLSPEQNFAPEGGDMDGIAQSHLTLEAEAPQDDDATRFLLRLQQTLPGRAALQHLSLERTNPTALSATNIHLKAEIDWLSNSTQP